MRKNFLKQIISICMIFTMIVLSLNIVSTAADLPEQSKDIYLINSPEKDYDFWTFSDLGIVNQSDNKNLNWDTKVESAGDSLDKTVFNAKINFPSGTSNFGNYYIGSSYKWYGFVFLADGTDGLKLYYTCKDTGHFHNSNGNTGSNSMSGNQVALFNPKNAGTTLRGNSDLQLSLSVEYVEQNGDIVNLKVGVFFDGKLYDGEYYTVKDVPSSELSKNIGFYVLNSSKYTIASHYVEQNGTTLNDSPAKDYDYWTFSDLGIVNQTSKTHLNWEEAKKAQAAGSSLDKTVFDAKINFPSGTNNFGNYYIGSSYKWYGFIFLADGTDGLKLYYNCKGTGHFHNNMGDTGTSGMTNTQLASFNSEKAATTLRGNSNLQASIAVEYIEEKGDNVDLKVQVYFDGKLYNNEYYLVKAVPKAELSKNLGFYVSNSSEYTIASHYMDITEITVDSSPEKDYDFWTFSDLGIVNQTGNKSLNWDSKKVSIGDSLNKTVFDAKINFPSGTNDFGSYYIGSSEKWYGLFFCADGADGLKLYYNCKGTGHFHNSMGDTGTNGMINTYFGIFNSEEAKTTLRGNSDLRLSLSVEYINENGDNTDLKIGVFFDGKLYNGRYLTVKNVPKAELSMNIGLYVQNNAEYTIASVEQEKEDVLFQSTPENNFDFWTFSDLGIVNQTGNKSLNWDSKKASIGESLNKTVFDAKINFPSGTNNFGSYYIGSSEKWYGLFFCADETDGLKLYYNCKGTGNFHNGKGDTGTKAMSGTEIASFISEKAGSKLRGNNDLRVSLSVEYINEAEDITDLKVGVFFDGKLYNGKYLTVKDVPKAELSKNIGFYVQDDAEYTISSVEHKKDDILLKKTSENNYDFWTFADFGILDQTSSVGLNWDAKLPAISNSLNKTVFNGKINFPSGTNNFGQYYIGSSEKWYGLFFYADGEDGLQLYYNCKGTGNFHNEKGDTGTKTMSGTQIANFISEKAGTKIRGNSNLTVSVSVEYINESKDKTDLKVGVYFDGKLYNSRYLTVKDIPKAELSKNLGFYVADSKPYTIASVGKVYKEKTYEELSLDDFSINDTYVAEIPSGKKDYRTENYCDLESLNNTAFSAVCRMPKSGEARFVLGTPFWYGVLFSSTKDGRIQVAFVDKDASVKSFVYLDAKTAGLDSFASEDFNIKLTFDISETESGKGDIILGVYINGKLYSGQHFCVRNITTELLTRNLQIYAKDVPFSIKSSKQDIDLSIYGYSNNNWKKQIVG